MAIGEVGKPLRERNEQGKVIYGWTHCAACQKGFVKRKPWHRFCKATCKEDWWWRERQARPPDQ
jgi:hypothetical protein